jgi:hypothetical protein
LVTFTQQWRCCEHAGWSSRRRSFRLKTINGWSR